MTHLPDIAPDMPTATRRQRVAGHGELRIDGRGDIAHLYQQGAARIRLPARHTATTDAVLLNTAGGLTGGDRLRWQASVAGGACLTLTSAACEKAYRAEPGTGAARLDVHLDVAAGARLDWLPQETLLFEGSHLERRLDVALAADAECLLLESLVLGRRAMGEIPRSLVFADRWTVRRDGVLLHAEAQRIDAVRALEGPAALDAHACLATLLFFSTRGNEALALLAERVHGRLSTSDTTASLFGVSVLPGRLVLRVLARDTLVLRVALRAALAPLRDDAPLPRVWQC